MDCGLKKYVAKMAAEVKFGEFLIFFPFTADIPDAHMFFTVYILLFIGDWNLKEMRQQDHKFQYEGKATRLWGTSIALHPETGYATVCCNFSELCMYRKMIDLKYSRVLW